MDKHEILGLAYAAVNNGEICRIKLPAAREIHAFNMAVNELERSGYIKIEKRSMTEIVIELTESGLEQFL